MQIMGWTTASMPRRYAAGPGQLASAQECRRLESGSGRQAVTQMRGLDVLEDAGLRPTERVTAVYRTADDGPGSRRKSGAIGAGSRDTRRVDCGPRPSHRHGSDPALEARALAYRKPCDKPRRRTRCGPPSKAASAYVVAHPRRPGAADGDHARRGHDAGLQPVNRNDEIPHHVASALAAWAEGDRKLGPREVIGERITKGGNRVTMTRPARLEVRTDSCEACGGFLASHGFVGDIWVSTELARGMVHLGKGVYGVPTSRPRKAPRSGATVRFRLGNRRVHGDREVLGLSDGAEGPRLRSSLSALRGCYPPGLTVQPDYGH